MHAALDEAWERKSWRMRTNIMQCFQMSRNEVIWNSKTAENSQAFLNREHTVFASVQL